MAVSLTLVDNNGSKETDSSGNVSYTMSFGATDTNRGLVVAVGYASASITLNTVTVGGSAASVIKTATNGSHKIQVWGVINDSGTSGTVALAFSGDVPDNISVGLFRLTGQNGGIITPSNTADATASSSTSVTISSLTIPTSGAGLYAAKESDDNNISWENATVAYDHDLGTSDEASAALTSTPGTPAVKASCSQSESWAMVGLVWETQAAAGGGEPEEGGEGFSENPYTSVSVDSYDASPPLDDGSESDTQNEISWARIKGQIHDPINIAAGSIDTNIEAAFGSTLLSLRSVLMDAGTASVAPIRLQSGTALTTPLSGAWEYDGAALYNIFAAEQRGVSPSVQLVANISDVSLADDTNAQSPFDAANDALTAAATTTYLFESFIYLTVGGNSHTTAFGLGGTATLTSILYWSELVSSTAATIATTMSRLEVVAGSATVLNAASTATSAKIRLNGVIRVNGAGTLIPQITFSAAPGSTNLAKTNSFFRLYPVGSNTVASVGSWA